MIFLLCSTLLITQQIALRPVTSRKFITSFIAQKLTLTIPQNVCDFFLTINPQIYGRLFFSEQINGTTLGYSQNYSLNNLFPLHFYQFLNNSLPLTSETYQFKINSNFSSDEQIVILMRFTETGECPIPNHTEIIDEFIHSPNRKETVYFTEQRFRFITYIILLSLISCSLSTSTIKIKLLLFCLFCIVFEEIDDALLKFFNTKMDFNRLFHSLLILYVLFYNKQNVYGFSLYFYAFLTNDILTQILLILMFSLYSKISFKISFLIITSELWIFFFESYNLIDFIILFYHTKRSFPSVQIFIFVLFSLCSYIILILYLKPNKTEDFNVKIEPFVSQMSFLGDTIDKIKKAADETFTLEKCNMCNFTPLYQPSSTERDLIIVQTGNFPEKSKSALFSLRTTGCKAKVVLTMTENDKLDPAYAEQLKDCGIFVVRLNKIFKHKFLMYMKIVRFPMFAEFLEKYGNSFDRVLYFDTFDTVFQADPFREIKNKHTLYMSSEYNSISHNKYLIEWIGRLPGFNSSFYNDSVVVCSGVFGGYSDVIMKLGQIMKALYKLDNDFITNDQACFDFLWYSGIMKNAGLNPTITDEFPSAGYILPKMPLQRLGEIKLNGIKPCLIHHLNRNHDYVNDAKKVCNIS